MSIVIPVGVDTADTSYLDMAAGSEWVTPGLYCAHFYAPSLPLIHCCVPSFVVLYHQNVTLSFALLSFILHLTPLLCVIYSFIWARLSPSPFQGPQHALRNNWSRCKKNFSLSTLSFQTDIFSYIYKATVNGKGIFRKQGPSSVRSNGLFSVVIDSCRCSHCWAVNYIYHVNLHCMCAVCL